jgi:hypothetical protein
MHVGDPVVLGQRAPQLRAKPLPGLVGDRQRVRPDVLQAGHELPEIEREVGGEKKNVHRVLTL